MTYKYKKENFLRDIIDYVVGLLLKLQGLLRSTQAKQKLHYNLNVYERKCSMYTMHYQSYHFWIYLNSLHCTKCSDERFYTSPAHTVDTRIAVFIKSRPK